jgi:glutaredoxin
MAFEFKHVAGENLGHVALYALGTCAWCRKTKRLLNDLGVDYYYVDVDNLVGSEKVEANDEVRKWNPACSFPTLVVNDKDCIVGFDEQKVRRALGL